MPEHDCPEYKDDHGHPTGRCWLKTKAKPVKCGRDATATRRPWVRCIHWLGPEEGGGN